ncbi:MAG: hypothetical protein KDA24_00400 [Deltaproteobacteria bacterium]|nr:hypothetical protein [Deltaproteobacteria bacterium]
MLGPDDILRVDVDCGALTSAMERVVGGLELSPSAVNYSVRRSIAVLLIAGELGPQQLTRAWVADHSEAIDSLAEKIRVHHDWRLSLASWNALRGTGVQRLLTEVGPGPLLSALGRGGGLEAGLSLTELPLAIAGDRLQGVPPDELPALFGRGLSKLTDFAARGLERLLPAAVTPRRSDEFDLAEQSLEGLHVVFPARVRVLLHGGHVHQAAVDEPAGSPARPPEERRAAVRAKLLQALLQADPTDQARHHSLAEALLGVGNARGTHLTPLPGDGPAFLLGG